MAKTTTKTTKKATGTVNVYFSALKNQFTAATAQEHAAAKKIHADDPNYDWIIIAKDVDINKLDAYLKSLNESINE
jgi:hypothetical protein